MKFTEKEIDALITSITMDVLETEKNSSALSHIKETDNFEQLIDIPFVTLSIVQDILVKTIVQMEELRNRDN